MDTLGTDLMAIPRPFPQSWETPGGLFVVALLWLVAAFFVALLTAIVMFGFVRGAHLPSATAAQIVLIVTQAFLLAAAWSRARTVGHGDAIAGLGGANIQRPNLLAALFVSIVICGGGASLLAYWLNVVPPDPGWAADYQTGDLFTRELLLLNMVCLGPIWEELFFRGWLWTGLRRHWRTLPVMLATCLPWLLLHGPSCVFLIPGAIALCLARQFCGGVRASIVLHVLNNLTIAALLTCMTLLWPP